MKEKVEETKVQDEITAGQRLEAVILKYFEKQSILAEKAQVSPNTISQYISGRIGISKKTAMRMQDLAGINANYLLNGEEPMMIANTQPAKPYKILHQGDVPAIKSKQEQKTHYRGIIKQMLLESSGSRRENLIDNGEVNIMDVVIDGIKSPINILITATHFREKYQIKANASLVIGEEYTDGNTVLAFDGKQFMLLEIDGEQMIDIADGKEVKDTESIDIIGAVFSLTTRL